MMKLRKAFSLLALCLLFLVPGMAQEADDSAASPFTDHTVADLARKLAGEGYHPQVQPADDKLFSSLSYDQYRDIRFKPEAALWKNESLPFQLQLFPIGFTFKAPVEITVVDREAARNIVSDSRLFSLGTLASSTLSGHAIPLSGFRVHATINKPSVWDEFLVFQGASYFRAVPENAGYGLSARGLAIRTASPKGEEFPSFTHFWIVKPNAGDSELVIYALLDSVSATGAYRFTVQPGAETLMDVQARLFPRVDLDDVGIAPLTSMFLFDPSRRDRINDFREGVHDSDGLKIQSASGESIWRQLINPRSLQVGSFSLGPAPSGFGLVQRDRSFSNYEDLEAGYENRPSAWVEPLGQWNPGSVELVEIPSESETNDNIVAFWRPAETLTAGKEWDYSYRIHWLATGLIAPGLCPVSATRTGPSEDGKRRFFLVDFADSHEKLEDLKLEISSSRGRLYNEVLQPNPSIKGVRVSFELDPQDAKLAELRLRLVGPQGPVSETWLYRWLAQ